MRLQAASALDVVIHVERTQQSRKVTCVGLVGDGPDGLTVLPAWEGGEGPVGTGPAWPILAERLGLGLGELQ